MGVAQRVLIYWLLIGYEFGTDIAMQFVQGQGLYCMKTKKILFCGWYIQFPPLQPL